MKKINYETKEMPLTPVTKEYKYAIAPNGNGYSVIDNLDDFLSAFGFRSISDAKKAGWDFK